MPVRINFGGNTTKHVVIQLLLVVLITTQALNYQNEAVYVPMNSESERAIFWEDDDNYTLSLSLLDTVFGNYSYEFDTNFNFDGNVYTRIDKTVAPVSSTSFFYYDYQLANYTTGKVISSYYKQKILNTGYYLNFTGHCDYSSASPNLHDFSILDTTSSLVHDQVDCFNTYSYNESLSDVPIAINETSKILYTTSFSNETLVTVAGEFNTTKILLDLNEFNATTSFEFNNGQTSYVNIEYLGDGTADFDDNGTISNIPYEAYTLEYWYSLKYRIFIKYNDTDSVEYEISKLFNNFDFDSFSSSTTSTGSTTYNQSTSDTNPSSGDPTDTNTADTTGSNSNTSTSVDNTSSITTNVSISKTIISTTNLLSYHMFGIILVPMLLIPIVRSRNRLVNRIRH